MTLKEIFESGAGQFMAASHFKDAGITLEDNTAEEILDAVTEMVDGSCSVYHSEIWDQFPLKSVSPFNKKPLHGNVTVRVGREFAKGYL